ncbi:hypothetical protein [Parageobacillus toebii]|uniref:hypothetical protein n=1 Tax=Parageobacillus toebii TaxID=153151 RepID=UPI0035B5696F
MLFVLLGIFGSLLASFFLSYFLLGRSPIDASEKEYKEQLEVIKELQNIEKFQWLKKPIPSDPSLQDNMNKTKVEGFNKPVRSIVFVCEAGMGSSAVGAAMLRKKLKESKLNIKVSNSSLQEIPKDVDLIICHKTFLKSVQEVAPNKVYYPLQSFTNFHEYDELVNKIKISKECAQQ